MTCYGAGEAEANGLRIIVEVRSVNHRFLDVQLRLPRDYISLEAPVSAAVRDHFTRGRVEVFVRKEEAAAASEVQFDVRLAKAYRDGLTSLKRDLGLSGDIDLALILTQPGVLSHQEHLRQAEVDWPLIHDALTRALTHADQMRATEGQALAEDLGRRFAFIDTARAEISAQSDGVVDSYRERLVTRVQDLLTRAGAGELDQGRLLQEVVHLSDRTDVSEELTRLSSHLDQCRQQIAGAEPSGRKLDFLLQELLREVNTLASKTPLAEVKRHVVDIKVELEKIREQVQNIE